jgi:hypothetical protein
MGQTALKPRIREVGLAHGEAVSSARRTAPSGEDVANLERRVDWVGHSRR